MSDTILYEKQKAKLAKAVGKAQQALADVTLVLASIGIAPTVDEEAPSSEPKAPRKPRAEKASKAEKKAKTNGGSAFAEM